MQLGIFPAFKNERKISDFALIIPYNAGLELIYNTDFILLQSCQLLHIL
jgi:hypothetical protein